MVDQLSICIFTIVILGRFGNLLYRVCHKGKFYLDSVPIKKKSPLKLSNRKHSRFCCQWSEQIGNSTIAAMFEIQ